MEDLVFVVLFFFSPIFFLIMCFCTLIVQRCLYMSVFSKIRSVQHQTQSFPFSLPSTLSCFCLVSFPSACLRLRYVCLLFPCSHLSCVVFFFPLTCYYLCMPFPNRGTAKRSWTSSYWFKTHRPVRKIWGQ